MQQPFPGNGARKLITYFNVVTRWCLPKTRLRGPDGILTIMNESARTMNTIVAFTLGYSKGIESKGTCVYDLQV